MIQNIRIQPEFPSLLVMIYQKIFCFNVSELQSIAMEGMLFS